VWSYIAPNYLNVMQEALADFHTTELETGIKRYEIQLINASGNLIDVELSLSQTEYDGQSGIAIFMRDITERKLAELVVEETQIRLRAQAESLITINQIADSLHQILEVKEIAYRIVSISTKYLEADTSLFYLVDS